MYAWRISAFSSSLKCLGNGFSIDFKLSEAELYSYSGSFENLFNFDIKRYDKLGTVNNNAEYY